MDALALLESGRLTLSSETPEERAARLQIENRASWLATFRGGLTTLFAMGLATAIVHHCFGRLDGPPEAAKYAWGVVNLVAGGVVGHLLPRRA